MTRGARAGYMWRACIMFPAGHTFTVVVPICGTVPSLSGLLQFLQSHETHCLLQKCRPARKPPGQKVSRQVAKLSPEHVRLGQYFSGTEDRPTAEAMVVAIHLFRPKAQVDGPKSVGLVATSSTVARE